MVQEMEPEMAQVPATAQGLVLELVIVCLTVVFSLPVTIFWLAAAMVVADPVTEQVVRMAQVHVPEREPVPTYNRICCR